MKPALPDSMHPPAAETSYPYSAGLNRPGFTAPAGTCDCHMHFFSDEARPASGAVVVHPGATKDQYAEVQRRLGLSRYILVQPSTYGLDNRLLLDALAQSGGKARGVAVVNDQVTASTLRAMHNAGVRGVRFNLVQKGATSAAMLRPVAEAVKALGWHIQLHALQDDLIELEPQLNTLPVPIVLDHFARVMEDPAKAAATTEVVLRLIDTGNCWVKLSGAYIASPGQNFGVLDAFVRRLVTTHADRLLWGTDWPHATESSKPNDADLMDLLLRWIPAASTRNLVLVRNPETLYGFDRQPSELTAAGRATVSRPMSRPFK